MLLFFFVFVSFLGHAAVRLCLPDLGLMLGHCGLCRHHIGLMLSHFGGLCGLRWPLLVVCYPGYFDIFECFPSFAVLVCRSAGHGDGSKPWYRAVNPKIAGIYGCSSH